MWWLSRDGDGGKRCPRRIGRCQFWCSSILVYQNRKWCWCALGVILGILLSHVAVLRLELLGDGGECGEYVLCVVWSWRHTFWEGVVVTVLGIELLILLHRSMYVVCSQGKWLCGHLVHSSHGSSHRNWCTNQGMSLIVFLILLAQWLGVCIWVLVVLVWEQSWLGLLGLGLVGCQWTYESLV